MPNAHTRLRNRQWSFDAIASRTRGHTLPVVRVSKSRRLLFLHVQKTGGTTVERFFDQLIPDSERRNPKHGTWSQVLAAHPDLEDYYAFGFVRNPWDRLVSWRSMIEDAKTAPDTDKRAQYARDNPFWVEVGAFPDFASFIRALPTTRWKRLRTAQIDYLSHQGRRVDFIGRTETFDQDFDRLLSRWDLPRLPPRQHNTSTRGHYRDYYTPETCDIVAQVFQADLEAFGYRY